MVFCSDINTFILYLVLIIIIYTLTKASLKLSSPKLFSGLRPLKCMDITFKSKSAWNKKKIVLDSKANSGLQRGLNPWPQAPLKSWIFFRLLYAIAKIAIITARIILHLISYPQFTYDLFHMHHSPKKKFCWLNNDVGIRIYKVYTRCAELSSLVQYLITCQSYSLVKKNCALTLFWKGN